LFSFVLVAVLALGGYLYFSGRDTSSLSTSDEGTNTLPTVKGRAVFSVTDVAANIENVNEVALTVNKVEAQSAARGWVTVSDTTRKYNLLALKASGNLEVLADANLETGKYNQVRLHVSEVAVIEKNGTTKKAKLPSGELKIVSGFTVEANKSASVVFDFLVDKSLHVTGKGEYIFAPVVKVESKSNAQVAVESNGKVSIVGGNAEADTTVGMDVNGSVKANFALNAGARLELVGGLIWPKPQGETDAGLSITAEEAAIIVVDKDYLDTAISINLDASGGGKVWRVSGIKNLLPAVVTIDAMTGARIIAE